MNELEDILQIIENTDGSMPEAPEYDPDVDYYREYYRMYLKNENLISDIDQSGTENFQMETKIHAIKQYYENTLIP